MASPRAPERRVRNTRWGCLGLDLDNSRRVVHRHYPTIEPRPLLDDDVRVLARVVGGGHQSKDTADVDRMAAAWKGPP